MKESADIDELLNGFIDGELTAMHQTEVQRLIAHDVRIAERLRELQKCKMLVGSLPRAEAPDEMAEEIKASLERKVLLSQQPERFDQRQGARHLLVRKVLTAAAIIGLVAVLLGVIYNIVAPESISEKPIVSGQWRQPGKKIKVEKTRPSIVATAGKLVDKGGAAPLATGGEMGFNGRLELKTSALIAVDAVINRAIEDNHLKYGRPAGQGDESIYVISCSREALSLLLADLGSVWDRFGSARLFVRTGWFANEVVVNGVSAGQIAEIVNQDSLADCVEVAKDFAVLNNLAELLPGKEILAAIDNRAGDLMVIPKPVLTSSQRAIKEPSRVEDKEEVHLTIVVVSGE